MKKFSAKYTETRLLLLVLGLLAIKIYIEPKHNKSAK